MDDSLIKIGVACVIGAVVGGGFKAFGIEIPLLSSVRRQLLLAGVGVLLAAIPMVSQSMKGTPSLPDLTVSTWTLDSAIDNDKDDWSNSTLKFASQRKTRNGLTLQGIFEWNSPEGPIGTEHFSGTYAAASRLIMIQGDSIHQDPDPQSRRGLTAGSYSAVLSADGRSLRDGRWGSVMGAPRGVPGRWSATR